MNLLEAAVTALVSAAASTITLHRLLMWRVRALERRLEPLDTGQRNVLTRLASLEARRSH